MRTELAIGVEGETTVGLEIEGDGRRAYYIPSCARITDALRARLDGADLLVLRRHDVTKTMR